jgi:hypothetical protein
VEKARWKHSAEVKNLTINNPFHKFMYLYSGFGYWMQLLTFPMVFLSFGNPPDLKSL